MTNFDYCDKIFVKGEKEMNNQQVKTLCSKNTDKIKVDFNCITDANNNNVTFEIKGLIR